MDNKFWDEAAQRDPLWAILSDPSKRGRRWELPAFFATGRREISLLFYQLRQLGHPVQGGRALDFGCGVGRLSQALAPSFTEVVGVDISPTMMNLANRLNRYPGIVRYVLNQSTSLSVFAAGEFDFIYSDIVLQHVEPDSALRYVREFLRLLSPGGVAVFQLPSHRRTNAEQTPQPRHMPPDAYRAGVSVVDTPPALAPGEKAVATIQVDNCSSLMWDQQASGTIRVGNHWTDTGGTLLIQDDGRTTLPALMKPEASIRLAVEIQAPPDGGAFVCEFDVVHEGISWFADFGSATAQVGIQVGSVSASSTAQPFRTESAYPADGVENASDFYAMLASTETDIADNFPMHGVPRDTVLELIRADGGTPFLIENDERGGPEWIGFRYFVAK